MIVKRYRLVFTKNISLTPPDQVWKTDLPHFVDVQVSTEYFYPRLPILVSSKPSHSLKRDLFN